MNKPTSITDLRPDPLHVTLESNGKWKVSFENGNVLRIEKTETVQDLIISVINNYDVLLDILEKGMDYAIQRDDSSSIDQLIENARKIAQFLVSAK